MNARQVGIEERFSNLARSLSRIAHAARPKDLGPEFTLDPFHAACDLALLLRGNLGPVERIVLAEAALQSLDRDDAAELAESVLNDTGQGWPLPHPRSISAEAASWAATATRPELVALMSAIWQRLNEMDRTDFLKAAA